MGAIKSTLAGGGANPGLLAARVAWEARRLLRRLGWGACAGALSLALAGAGAWQAQRLDLRQEQLTADIAQARARRLAPQPVPVPDSTRRLAAFHDYLPAHETIPELLKQLVGAADKNGIALAKADYKPQADDGAAFMRYEITLPVKADYARVQAFIVSALRELPTLTLDSVTFQREQIESGEVEAKLHFKLLVRNPVRKGGRR